MGSCEGRRSNPERGGSSVAEGNQKYIMAAGMSVRHKVLGRVNKGVKAEPGKKYPIIQGGRHNGKRRETGSMAL